MKEAIQYKADKKVQNIIAQWLFWLKNEDRYSPHTLDAYADFIRTPF